MHLAAFVIQYEESLCYYMTVKNFSSAEACSGVKITRNFIIWAWLSFFFYSPSFAVSPYPTIFCLTWALKGCWSH